MGGRVVPDFEQRRLGHFERAHENTNKAESAYHRDNMLERLLQLMDAWGRFCVGSNGVP